MSPTRSIHEVAEAEINETADFYDVESPGQRPPGPTGLGAMMTAGG